MLSFACISSKLLQTSINRLQFFYLLLRESIKNFYEVVI